MTEVYLALGANVGDARANIARAVELLEESIEHIQQAPVYKTKPVGYADQPDFLNSVLSGQTELTAAELFQFVKGIEQQLGRVERFRNGPREIDIDIIFYGDQIIENEYLTIPHPRFRKRDFVLRPLADLNPSFIDPVSRKTIQQLLGEVSNSS